MNSPAQDNDRIIAEARASLVRQKAGGRRLQPVGRASAERRRAHQLRKVLNMTAAVVAILVAAIATGIFINGIGFTGVMLTALAILGALFFFGMFPRFEIPRMAALNSGDAKTLVGNTELWLEAQRPALPAPAVQLVDQIGVQLDALGLQLERVDERAPAVAEVRKLVGEHLPGLVETYTSIPRHLRSAPNAGRTPDDQLVESLSKISTEIGSVTRQLAEGQLDNLAIQTRYLDYRYGEGVEGEKTG